MTVYPDTPEWEALELAHMIFGVEIEYFSRYQNQWRLRSANTKHCPFNKTLMYRRRDEHVEPQSI